MWQPQHQRNHVEMFTALLTAMIRLDITAAGGIVPTNRETDFAPSVDANSPFWPAEAYNLESHTNGFLSLTPVGVKCSVLRVTTVKS